MAVRFPSSSKAHCWQGRAVRLSIKRRHGAEPDRKRTAMAGRRLWCQGHGPDIDVFLARTGPLVYRGAGYVLRVDQRDLWQKGEQVLAEAYLERYPALLDHPERRAVRHRLVGDDPVARAGTLAVANPRRPAREVVPRNAA